MHDGSEPSLANQCFLVLSIILVLVIVLVNFHFSSDIFVC